MRRIYETAHVELSNYQRLKEFDNPHGAAVSTVEPLLVAIEAFANGLPGRDRADLLSEIAAVRGEGARTPAQHRSRQIFDYKISNRSDLAALGKQYHAAVDPMPSFPLIARREWLPEMLVRLSDVKLEWLGADLPVALPLALPIFRGESCMDWSRRVNKRMTLTNDDCYRLVQLGGGPSGAFAFQNCTYADYINTCEAIAFELAAWRVDHLDDRVVGDLTFRSGPDRIFDFSWRNCVPGQNALLVIFNGPNGIDEFCLHERSAELLAEAQGTLHVVPSGTFQPYGYSYAYQQRDFSLAYAIWREFAEELLGQAEVDHARRDGLDFTDFSHVAFRRLEPYVRGVSEGHVNLFYLGIGLDPVTTKPEILLCITVDARAVGLTNYDQFRGNWEGKHFYAHWSREELLDFSTRRKTLPAGAAALTRALLLFDQIDATRSTPPPGRRRKE